MWAAPVETRKLNAPPSQLILLIQHQAEMTEINESVPNNVMFDWLID